MGARFCCRNAVTSFIRRGFQEWIVAVHVGNGVTIFLHVFVEAEIGGWDDDGCV